jgi:hypothetical protein
MPGQGQGPRQPIHSNLHLLMPEDEMRVPRWVLTFPESGFKSSCCRVGRRRPSNKHGLGPADCDPQNTLSGSLICFHLFLFKSEIYLFIKVFIWFSIHFSSKILHGLSLTILWMSTANLNLCFISNGYSWIWSVLLTLTLKCGSQ